jgi:hypothetical protein
VRTLSIVSNEVGEELILDVESPLPLGFKVSGNAVLELGDKVGSTATTETGVIVVPTGDPVAAITGAVVVAVVDGTDDGANGDCDGG